LSSSVSCAFHFKLYFKFTFLVLAGFPMPQYSETVSKDIKELKSNQNKESKKRKSNFLLLLLVLIWFFISGGMEGFFQSQTYTFGICGPHRMEPGKVR
jgi:hypothetical protein